MNSVTKTTDIFSKLAYTRLDEYCSRIEESGKECHVSVIASAQAWIRLEVGPMFVDFIAPTWAELYEQLTSIPLY